MGREKLRDIGWALAPAGGLLRRLAGWGELGGKFWWRWLGPITVALIAWIYGFRVTRCVLTAAGLAGVASLGIEGAWAHDARVLLLIGQGALAGLALWPLAGVRLRWPILTIPARAWVLPPVLGILHGGLMVVTNCTSVMPHALYEASWGFVLYGAAAWLIVEWGPEE